MLSVVVASWTAPAALAECLESLRGQLRVGNDEIVVARNFDAGPFPPDVVDVFVGRGVSVPRLRAAGFQVARGRIVAFIEDHSTATPGWRDAVVEVQSTGSHVATGPVAPVANGSALSDAIYLQDYARFAPPIDAGKPTSLSGANMFFDRNWLVEAGLVHEDGVHEARIVRSLRAAGDGVAVAPDAIIAVHRRERPAQALSLAFNLARGFSADRADDERTTVRVLRALAFPLVAGLLLARTLAIPEARSILGRRVLRALPWLMALNMVWALGEAAGAIAGAGTSHAKWR